MCATSVPAVCRCALVIHVPLVRSGLLLHRAVINWSFVERNLRGRLVNYLRGSKPTRRGILAFLWELVDREAAVCRIDAIVANAIGLFKDPETEDSFQGEVMLALSMPGIGMSRLLVELKERLEAALKREFDGQFHSTINLMFCLSTWCCNEVQRGLEAKSIDALLGWRALRHYFCPDNRIDGFYRE
jgi:hypothetical protein